MQDSVDDPLVGLDKENEGRMRNLNGNNKSSSNSEGRERERNARIRPLTVLTTSASNKNQTAKLPEITSPHHSQVICTNTEMQKRSLFSFTRQKALASTSWMDGDGSGSAHTTRFELPMDMKTLEGK